MWKAIIPVILVLSTSACGNKARYMEDHNVYDLQATDSGFSMLIRNKKMSTKEFRFDGDKAADRDTLIREVLGASCPGLQHELAAELDHGKAGLQYFLGYGKKRRKEYIHKITCQTEPEVSAPQ